MMKHNKTEIEIPIPEIDGLSLWVYSSKVDTIRFLENDKEEILESPYQLFEGHYYYYYFEFDKVVCNEYQLVENTIVTHSKRNKVAEGRISPNIYVGSLPLKITRNKQQQEPQVLATIYLEVLPTKLNKNYQPEPDEAYSENYKFMLQDITKVATELLLQVESPVEQHFEIDYETDNRTLYQRFAFVKSLIENEDFEDAVMRVLSNPNSKWDDTLEEKDTRALKRVTNRTVRQLVSGSNRVTLDKAIGNLTSVPVKIQNTQKKESFDTHENRFVKHTLEVYFQFVEQCKSIFEKNNYQKSYKEAQILGEKLDEYLSYPLFKQINRASTLKLNSPVLQRKGGYRQLLNSWLQFDLAAKLIWKGGDDVYRAGKRDIATLYEYWLFFKLHELFAQKFAIENYTFDDKTYDSLVGETKDGLNLLLKSGKTTSICGKSDKTKRKLIVQFSYNKSFSGGVEYDIGTEGSWTKPMRPDYTFSIWPFGMTDVEAEKQEKIVHIHFDSKYKVNQFKVPIKNDAHQNEIENELDPSLEDELQNEKFEERKGTYKHVDLYKMHAYKDAIRRTSGAYILYPGYDNDEPPKRGFHEIIPGLGAFAIRPSKANNGEDTSGIKSLEAFLDEVIEHFNNMASQHRRMAHKIYEIHDQPIQEVNDVLPEYIIPDETYVLVGYYKGEKHLNWIKEKNLYNIRYGQKYSLTPQEVGAAYLLLYTVEKKQIKFHTELLKINQSNKKEEQSDVSFNGPRFFSKKELEDVLDYHETPSQEMYLVYSLAQESDLKLSDFSNQPNKSIIDKLSKKQYEPFSISLSEFLSK
jgi:predicted component of viral defense system (DUF524 family)